MTPPAPGEHVRRRKARLAEAARPLAARDLPEADDPAEVHALAKRRRLARRFAAAARRRKARR